MTEKDIIHKLTYLLHGHRRKIFIIFGCLLISTGLNLCIPFISKEIMDEGFIGGNKNILLYLVVGSFAIYMLISALNIIKEKVRVEIVAKVQYICLYKQVSDAMLKIACRDSGLEDFIKEVSLDYVVGQNGAMLSGGQKQKIALARALIHDKPIIIFDEATSNTDAYSEQQINALLHTGLRDKTVIVITHKKEV